MGHSIMDARHSKPSAATQYTRFHGRAASQKVGVTEVAAWGDVEGVVHVAVTAIAARHVEVVFADPIAGVGLAGAGAIGQLQAVVHRYPTNEAVIRRQPTAGAAKSTTPTRREAAGALGGGRGRFGVPRSRTVRSDPPVR